MEFDFPIAEPQLPEPIKLAIEQSCQKFERKFQPYLLFVSAQVPGWVSEYREELEAIARLASLPTGEAKREPVAPVAGTGQ